MTLLWFLCAAAPPFFHALSSLVDQYVIRKYTLGSPLLFLSFSGFVCAPIALVIACFMPVLNDVAVMQAAWIIMSAWLFSACCIPYVYAMADADAHEFTPVFQTAPIFVTLFCWLFWGETLTGNQMIGGLVVIMAAAFSMTDLRRFKFKARPFFLITLGMIFYALFVTTLRVVSVEMNWLQITFWLCVGWSFLPLVLMGVYPSVRRGMIQTIRETRGRVLIYASVQELADIGANATRAAALGFVAIPAAVTDVVGGLQVVFILFFSVIAARLLPQIYTFDLTVRQIIYKLGCFLVMMAGLWLLIAV